MKKMTKEEIQQTLEEIYSKLDVLQETELAQNDEEFIWEIGEAMGSVDNALTVLEERE